ncbi:MAG: cytochrome c [Burkholderiaceae bacterium]
MSDNDRHAIAGYLKSLTPSPDVPSRVPDPGAMKRGAAIYSDVCTPCHLGNGVGQSREFPPLGGDATLQQTDAIGLEHLILAGAGTAPTPLRPTALTMPSFAWKLTDSEIADVGTYVRNSWGNRAPPIAVDEVRELRQKLHLDQPRLTANSGDRN